MVAGGKGVTLANISTFLEMSGADREADEIISAAHLQIPDLGQQEQGYGRTVDVSTLREDLLLRLERERSDDVIGMRAKQKQIMADKKGREAELLELQKAEESHRDLLLKDRDERNKIAKDLHSLRKGYLVDMEEETRRELDSLQREKEVLQAKEKDNLDAIDEVRRQIMEQDEVFHRAIDEAGSKIKKGKNGVDKDGRPAANASKAQRQAIRLEQVALAEGFGKRAGTLREEQTRLKEELQNVDGRIQKAKKDGGVSPKGGEDALAALMTEAGMEEQATRLRRLKVEFAKQHAEDVGDGFIKEYERAEGKTRKSLKNSARLLEGRTGEYAEATADEFLDEWLKTDADRARDAAAAAAAAAAASAGPTESVSPHPEATPLDRTKHEGGASSTEVGSGGRRASASGTNGGKPSRASKHKGDSSHAHGRRHEHHHHGHSKVGKHAHETHTHPHGAAATSSTSTSDSEGGPQRGHGAGGGAPHGKAVGGGDRILLQRRRNATVSPNSPVLGLAPNSRAGNEDSGAKHDSRWGGGPHASVPQLFRDPEAASASVRANDRGGEGQESRRTHDGSPEPPNSKPSGQLQGEGEEQESLRQAKNDTAQLRATVQRLESELNAVKAGAGMGVGGVSRRLFGGEGFGLDGGHKGAPFGGVGGPTAGLPWMAGGGAGPGLPQYIASLDAENARMMAEIRGLSGSGGTSAMFGPPGLAGVPNMGLQSLFPGAGGTTGGGAGYVGPGLQGDDIIGAGFEETLGGGKNTGAEGGGKPTRKRSGATRGKGAETEWDGALEDDGGGPMSPRNREYRRKMIELDAEQKEAVKRLEFEMQRLELQQQLEDMRERMAREKKTRQQDVAHEQWVTEQKRNLQAIKIEKTLAKERQLMAVQQTLTDARGGGGGHGGRPYAGFGGVATTLQAAGGWRPGVGGIVQRPYNKDQGFCVFWDYLTGLPKRSGSKIIGKVRLAFGLYTGKRLHGKMLSTPWTDIAPRPVKNDNTGKPETFCKLETRSTFPGIPLHVQTKLVVELQFKDEAGVQAKGGKGNLGWGCFYVFKPEKGFPHRLTVRAGLTRLTLFPGSVDLRIANVNDDKSAVSRSTPTAAFIRLVHGEDMNPAAAFVVDPDTQHLYTAYGRGNISQMERQKLMTGTFLRAILIIGKLKRSLASLKRMRASGGDAPKQTPHLQRSASRRASFKARGTNAFSSSTANGPELQTEEAAATAGSIDSPDGARAKPAKASKQPPPEPEKSAESSESDNRDSDEEQDSENDDEGSPEEDERGPMERRRSSLSSLNSQLAGQKTMAKRASMSKRRRSTISRQQFLKGDGFDFYADQACGMPYSCTISKVVVKVFGDVGDEGDCSAMSKADSPSNNPVFGLRKEYRTGPDERMEMTSTMMIRVDTLDRFSSEHRVVGYALLAIFMDPSGNQPTNASADGAFLREGNYQLPLYQKPPPDLRRVTSTSLSKCRRVPCASVLVRLKPASKSSAGKTLSREDVPEDEWKHFGLALPIPEFAPGVYDNSDLQLTDLERQILELRSRDKAVEVVGETGKLIESSDDPAPAYVDEEDNEDFEKWAADSMTKKPTKMIEYHHCERYRPDQGFTVIVAGLTNMKPSGTFKPPRLYKVIFSLLRPGLFYLGDLPAGDQAEFTHTYDRRSPQTAPRFRDPPHAFRNQNVDTNQFIVVDVRFLKVDGKEGSAVPEEPSLAPASGAWGILPAFAADDVATGTFMVPLLSGPVPVEILKAENPMKFLVDKVKAKHPNFRPLEGSSAVAQICNALLQDVLPPAIQDPSLNFIFVKRITDAQGTQQEKYAFDHVTDAGQKAVARVVPKGFKGRHEDFFASANLRFSSETGLSFLAKPVASFRDRS